MGIQVQTNQVFSLAEAALSGDRLALARVLTQVENDTLQGREALGELFPYTGRAHLIGITGSPGTGKSSLVNRLARAYRKRHHPERGDRLRVAVVAVDPSSPFSGGAVLGDRVRMRDLAGDPGIFIRSMASRGALGGLARNTAGVVQVFDAVGFDVVLIETVGAGQAEVDIASLAHTTIVVEAPGLGDDIQAIKAGILEIADILVINKADRPGAENAERTLRMMLELSHPTQTLYHHPRCPEPDSPLAIPLEPVDALHPEPDALPDQESWTPPVLRTIAVQNSGTVELLEAIDRHTVFLRSSGERLRRDRERLQVELIDRLQAALVEQWRARIPDNTYRQVFIDLADRRISPQQAVDRLLQSRG